jgi:tetratricopeptide (TPR) repeat protein
MNRLQIVLACAVALELCGAAAVIGLRLNATVPQPPHVEEYTDALTGGELLELPERHIFDSPPKWRELGEAYLAFGFFSKADACLSRAAPERAVVPDLALLHGYCLERLGEIEEAQAQLLRATETEDLRISDQAWYLLGRNELRLERPDEALRAFEKASDSHLPSLHHRAWVLLRQNRADAARPLVERLTKQSPNDLQLWRLRARLAEQPGQPDAAVDLHDGLERADIAIVFDELAPRLGAIRQRFGMAREIAVANELQRAGDIAGAAALLARLVRGETGWHRRYLTLLQNAAEIQGMAGDSATARQLLRRQFDEYRFPTARSWELLGNIEFHEEHFDEAREAWSRSARMLPNPALHMKLSQLPSTSDDDRARHVATAGLLTGIQRFRENRLEESRQVLSDVVSRNPQLSSAWFYLGEIARSGGHSDDSVAAYRRCLELNPDHGRARRQIERSMK